jgi:long-chain acyl-CoA synthetase
MDDRPWFKNYEPGLARTLKPYPNKTLFQLVAETAVERPRHTALIFKGRRMSYAELDRLSNDFGNALVALGVKKGDRVALLLPNSPQAVIAQLGAWKAGAIVAPMNPLYTERELEHALNEITAETVVVLNPFYAKVKSLQSRTSVKRVIASNIKDHLSPLLKVLFTVAKEKKEGYRITLDPSDFRMTSLLRKHAGSGPPPVNVTPQDRALLLFSGGTTGTPKAALGSHLSVVQTAMQLHAYAATVLKDWDDILTWVMPIFHVYGNMALNTALVAKWPAAVVPNPRDIDDLVATLRKVRPSCLHGVPTLFIALLNHPKVKAGQVDFKTMKVCWSGAAPLMLETKQRFEDLTGGWLLEAYGMTETMLAAVVCPIHAPYKAGSTGLPLPDVDVRIMDAETGAKEMPLGQVGELTIQAPQIMECYWNQPEETALMIRDGWVFTGDLGYVDEDGYVFVVDRKKDLIKPASGFQVWPREVEEIIATHPAVAEVSVAGVRDGAGNELVKAWIVLRADQHATADEIIAFCRTKLAGYKVPRHVEFRETLPKSMVGKVLRRLLVEEQAN